MSEGHALYVGNSPLSRFFEDGGVKNNPLAMTTPFSAPSRARSITVDIMSLLAVFSLPSCNIVCWPVISQCSGLEPPGRQGIYAVTESAFRGFGWMTVLENSACPRDDEHNAVLSCKLRI